MRHQHKIRGRFVAAAMGIFCLSAPEWVDAQSVVNPAVTEFYASTDHAVTVSGTPLVARYDLAYYLPGAAQPFQVQSIGKPTPAAGGLVRYDLSGVPRPTLGVVYETRVSAVGPGGVGMSAPSNTFMFTAPCTFAVTPSTLAIAPTGGVGTFTVATGAGCAWTAVSSTGWLTVTAGASGSGNGSVTVSAAPNTNTSNRTASLTIAGRSVTVTQSIPEPPGAPTGVHIVR